MARKRNTIAATAGSITVTLTPIPGDDGWWSQTQAEDGDVWGDAMAVHIEDETPQAYAQRWADRFAAQG